MKAVKQKQGRPPGQRQPLPDLVGQCFGDLRVLEFAGVKDSRRWWLCICLSTFRLGRECGLTRKVQTSSLNRGGGRRCSTCNKHLIEQRHHHASRWIYR